MVSRRHIEGHETVARGSLYHPKMVPTGSLEHTHTYIYIYIYIYIYGPQEGLQMVYLEICERFPRRCLKLPMMVPTRSAAGLVLKHNRRTLLFQHSGRGHRHDEITAAKAVRRPPEVHLVAPSRFGAQTQSARLTFSPFCAPTPPRRNYRREAVRRPPEVHLVAPSRFGAAQLPRDHFKPLLGNFSLGGVGAQNGEKVRRAGCV